MSVATAVGTTGKTTVKGVSTAARAVRSSPKSVTIGLTLGLAGWLLIDSGIKGEAPWDRLLTVFRGEPPKGRLKGSTVGSKVGTTATDSKGGGTGTLEMYGPWNDPKGHPTHLHWAHSSRAVLKQVGRELQTMGYTVRGNESFPPIGTHSGPSSLHYVQNGSLAIDINWNGLGSERPKLEAAAAYITKRVKELTRTGSGSGTSDPRQR